MLSSFFRSTMLLSTFTQIILFTDTDGRARFREEFDRTDGRQTRRAPVAADAQQRLPVAAQPGGIPQRIPLHREPGSGCSSSADRWR